MKKARPANEEELQKREAIGTIRASRFVRGYAKSKEPIDVRIICHIHQEIFRDAWPEIAGVYRDENLEITYSKHLPPHHFDKHHDYEPLKEIITNGIIDRYNDISRQFS
ncbi:hypothetical protein HYW94_01930 [Candidatus Uhrbacteria bacterium]|nr:hypothetical protein [Candidatus Uhrbacteria bacterium]